jgi:hypothetical protein
MAKPASAIDPAVLAAYDTMIAGVPGVERRGATLPYTSINGNMYSAINKANVIGLRLGKDDLAAFLAAYGATLHEGVPGFIQKEYASVPASLFADSATLQEWFRRSHAYASGLKPKKTTR